MYRSRCAVGRSNPRFRGMAEMPWKRLKPYAKLQEVANSAIAKIEACIAKVFLKRVARVAVFPMPDDVA